MSRAKLFLLAGISVLALAGCSSEPAQQAGSSTPPENHPGAQSQERDDPLGEDGGGLMREGEWLAGEARDRLRQALDDAGPMLERAGEIATEIGQSVEEIVQRAGDDLAAAARYLEERIEQSRQDLDLQPSHPDAVLARQTELRADTEAAAQALSAGDGPDYVGVWVAEASACSQIDQRAVENFAVITPTTMRRSESVCNIETRPLENSEVQVQASCLAEGMEEERTVSFSMPDIDTLNIRYDGAATGAELLRCYPRQ